MKKFILSGIVVGSFLLYVLYTKHEEIENTDAIAAIKNPQKLTSYSSSSSTTSNIKYKDGEYIGTRNDAFYGFIQVKVVIENGKISDVVFLEYPNDRDTSIQINTLAMVSLKSETIQSQSASVDIVTGATDTSLAFRQSLKAALTLAKF